MSVETTGRTTGGPVSAASTRRREQIMDAAVRVIAHEGSAGLSFAKVVEEAGISSTRLISYHFGTREALLEQTLSHILARAADFMRPRIEAASSYREKVVAYITSNFELLAQDLEDARAVIDLATTLGGSSDGGAIPLLEEVFLAGQAAGELRGFDVHVMAVSLRGTIDANVLDLHNSDTDGGQRAAEIAELFDRAIRR